MLTPVPAAEAGAEAGWEVLAGAWDRRVPLPLHKFHQFEHAKARKGKHSQASHCKMMRLRRILRLRRVRAAARRRRSASLISRP